MKKWILALVIISCSCFPAEAVFEVFKTKAKEAASSDQSLIAGQLDARALTNRTFVFMAPLTSDKVLTLTLLAGGKVQSNDTIVNRWDISGNSLNFYIVDELRASFRYDSSKKALVAKPFLVGKQATIKMWLVD